MREKWEEKENLKKIKRGHTTTSPSIFPSTYFISSSEIFQCKTVRNE
jgi:hypothetical protein